MQAPRSGHDQELCRTTEPIALDAIIGYTVSRYRLDQRDGRLVIDRDEAFVCARDNSFD